MGKPERFGDTCWPAVTERPGTRSLVSSIVKRVVELVTGKALMPTYLPKLRASILTVSDVEDWSPL